MTDEGLYHRRDGVRWVAIRLAPDFAAAVSAPTADIDMTATRWLVSDGCTTRMVDEPTFDAWFEELDQGNFRPPAKVRARRAEEAGRLTGGVRYDTGDWLLSTTTGDATFALKPTAFEASYQIDEGGKKGPAQPYRYRAFLSYSRQDARAARRLHSRLERYRLPHDLARGGDRSLGRFFKDDDELSGTDGLGAALNGAVDDSAALIVIASPASARSEWVEKEVRRFKRRRDARVLAWIVRGTPGSDDPNTECFAPSLRLRVDGRGQPTNRPADPPLAPDLQEERFERAFVRLVAGLLDIPFDSLWARERRRALRQRAIATVSALLLCFGLAVAVAATIGSSDYNTLRSRAIRLATEHWRFHSEGARFDSALRAARAAATLGPAPTDETWDLGAPEETTSFALALSGRLAPHRLLFGEHPDLESRGNYRDDIPDADPTRRLAIYRNPHVRDLGWSGDGKRLAMVTSSGRVLVYDVAAAQVTYDRGLEGVDSSSRIGMDDAGRHTLVSTRGGLVEIDVEARREQQIPLTELRRVHEIAHAQGSWQIAFEGQSGSCAAAWSEQKGLHDRATLPGFTPYNSRAFVADQRRFVAFADGDRLASVKLGDQSTPCTPIDGLASGVGQVKAIGVDATGNLVALGGNGSGSRFGAPIQVVSLTEREEHARLSGHTGEVYAVDFLGRTGVLASGGSDFTVRLWDTSSGSELLRLAGHVGDIYDLAASADGKMLASAGADGMVLVWDLSWLPECWDRGLRAPTWPDPQTGWSYASPVLTADERRSTTALQGRPWDLRDWRNPTSFEGIVQSLRSALVRGLGWSWFDYDQPMS